MNDSQAALYHDPLKAGLWNRYIDGDRINHAAWLRACASHEFVGTCRQCGSHLAPEQPVENAGRTDYTAHCIIGVQRIPVDGDGEKKAFRTEGCGWEMTAAGGRILRRSTRHSEMPGGWWERRTKALKNNDGAAT